MHLRSLIKRIIIIMVLAPQTFMWVSAASWQRNYVKDKWGDLTNDTVLFQTQPGTVNSNGASERITCQIGFSAKAPTNIFFNCLSDFIFPVLLYEDDESVKVSFRAGDKLVTCKAEALSNYKNSDSLTIGLGGPYSVTEFIFRGKFDVLIEGKDWYIRSSFDAVPPEPETLYFAIIANDYSMCEKSIKANANLSRSPLNLNMYYEFSAGKITFFPYIRAAFITRNTDILRLLVENGMNLNQSTLGGVWLYLDGKVDESLCGFLEEALRLGLNPNVGYGGLIPELHFKEDEDDQNAWRLECIKKIVSFGGDINKDNSDVLHSSLCFSEDSIDFINELLELGADINGDEFLLSWLWKDLDNIYKNNVSIPKVKDICPRLINFFIDKGLDINNQRRSKYPFIVGCVKEDIIPKARNPNGAGNDIYLAKAEIFIAEILAHGIDLTVRDNNGKDVMDYITEYEQSGGDELEIFKIIKSSYERQTR